MKFLKTWSYEKSEKTFNYDMIDSDQKIELQLDSAL